jgi:hypothetical protein
MKDLLVVFFGSALFIGIFCTVTFVSTAPVATPTVLAPRFLVTDTPRTMLYLVTDTKTGAEYLLSTNGGLVRLDTAAPPITSAALLEKP